MHATEAPATPVEILSLPPGSAPPRPRYLALDKAGKPVAAAYVLVFASRSKLSGVEVTVEGVAGKVVRVRAVDSGETDDIEVPFIQEIEAARRAMETRAKLYLCCIYQ